MHINNRNRYEESFNEWLVNNGLVSYKDYKKLNASGSIKLVKRTLPIYIRNVIHHPENENNTFSNEELNDSITQMLTILKKIEL